MKTRLDQNGQAHGLTTLKILISLEVKLLFSLPLVWEVYCQGIVAIGFFILLVYSSFHTVHYCHEFKRMEARVLCRQDMCFWKFFRKLASAISGYLESCQTDCCCHADFNRLLETQFNTDCSESFERRVYCCWIFLASLST